MKSVILCAGEGKRAFSYTDGDNKCLAVLPNFEKLVDYSLKTAIGLTGDIIVLIGYRGDEVRDYVINYSKNHSAWIRILFAEQKNLNGICDGLLCCESLLNGEDFLLFLGDEYLTETTHKTMIEKFNKNSVFAVCGFIYAKNPNDVRKTYSIESSGNIILDIKEKPTRPVNNLMGTGNCIFRNTIFDYIRDYRRKEDTNQTFSFPDVLKLAINKGETVLAHEIGKTYLNFNSKEDIIEFTGTMNTYMSG
jgi:dTDP-glucose pyrophosphorylase